LIAIFWLGLICVSVPRIFGVRIAVPDPLFKTGGAVFLMLLIAGFVATLLERHYHLPEKLSSFSTPSVAITSIVNSGRFLLYLRNTTFDHMVEGEVASPNGVAKSPRPRPVDSALRLAADSCGLRVVALWNGDDPNTHSSFEYIYVEDGRWKELVEGLLEVASCIVILLREKSPGILYETALLGDHSNAAPKTLIVASRHDDLDSWLSRLPQVLGACVAPPLLFSRRFSEAALDREEEDRAIAVFDISSWLCGGIRRGSMPKESAEQGPSPLPRARGGHSEGEG
jgi:hypothetical protein